MCKKYWYDKKDARSLFGILCAKNTNCICIFAHINVRLISGTYEHSTLSAIAPHS